MKESEKTLPLYSAIRDTALFPVWLWQLFANTKSFERNPLIRSAWLNRCGLHTRRIALAHQVARRRRRNLGRHVSSQDRSAFEKDGFIVRRDFVPPDLFANLLVEIRSYRSTARLSIQGDTLTRKLPLTKAALAQMPSLRRVVCSQEWRALQSYVGASLRQPTLYIQTVFTRARTAERDPQTFLHADTFHPTAKAWLFLADVTAEVPPFTYVPGSHRLTPLRLRWERRMSLEATQAENPHTRDGSFRISSQDLADMDLLEPVQLRVPANTLVVADTFGFHARGPSAAPAMRVEIWAMGRRRPFWGSRLPSLAIPNWLGAMVGAYKLKENAGAFDALDRDSD